MATEDKISTDLALEIGENLDPPRFIATVREFFGLIEELENPDNDQACLWHVRVQDGSNIIALEANPKSDSHTVKAGMERILHGVKALTTGDLSSPILTESAIQHAKKLSSLTRNWQRPVQIWLNKEPINYGPEIADTIREAEISSYSDYGTLEGILRAISEQTGSLRIRIYDVLWGSIPCRISDEQIESAMAAFRKRVEISGMIRYDRLGSPKSITMDSLTLLPDDSELPTIDDVQKAFA